jgi:hypothetical protein
VAAGSELSPETIVSMEAIAGRLPQGIDTPYDGDLTALITTPEDPVVDLQPAEIASFRAPDVGSLDYTLIRDVSDENVVIGVELSEPVPNSAQKALALRYQNQTGQQIGGSYSTYGITASVDTLMLEMIKGPDPRPEGRFGTTWTMMARNVYDLGAQHIRPGWYSIWIEDVLNPRADNTRPEGSMVPYKQIFGLDTTNLSGTGPPDGRVDASLLDLGRGLLRFPSIRPFAPEPYWVDDWTDGAFSFFDADSMYTTQYETSEQIYDQYLSATWEAEVHQYLIRVEFYYAPAGRPPG